MGAVSGALSVEKIHREKAERLNETLLNTIQDIQDRMDRFITTADDRLEVAETAHQKQKEDVVREIHQEFEQEKQAIVKRFNAEKSCLKKELDSKETVM